MEFGDFVHLKDLKTETADALILVKVDPVYARMGADIADRDFRE